MVEGRHLKKSRNGHISANGLIDLHGIWHGDANWPSEGYGQLKFQRLAIQDGGRPPS